MDTAESMLSMLDYTSLDPLSQDVSLDMNLGLGLDDILSNDFNLLQSEDHLFSDILNDDLLNTFDLTDSLCESDLFQSFSNTKNFASRNKSKNTFSPNKNSTTTALKTFSILNNSASKRSCPRVTISVSSPKVYVSPAHKKASSAGTSLLVKAKRSNKRRSLLMSASKEPTKQFEDIFNESSGLFHVVIPNVPDHDYCVIFNQDDTTNTSTTSPIAISLTRQPVSFAQDTLATCSSAQSLQNDLEDILDGFIPDDVLLNELPNCLQDLIGLDSDMLNSEDVLTGLNDVCNLMTGNYFDDLEQLYGMDSGLSLPNLEITEEELNAVAQSNTATSISNNLPSCAAKEIEVGLAYSPAPYSDSVVDSYDCSSVSTGFTEESSSEDFDSRPSQSPSPQKSKRHRSLSSSSVTSRRKRRFSSRSSVNSSDSMSDSSSPDSAPSSRSSSPERSLLNLVSGLGTFASPHIPAFHKSTVNHSKFHLVNKSRLRKHVNWSNKYASKYMKPKKKIKVIDLAQRNFSVSSHKALPRIETGSSHQVNSSSDINEKVLYIGDIPSGTKKSDIHSWFGKFGAIEDVQTYICENGNNYAFVTYKYSHETRNAIKHGNDDLRHPTFTLSFGKRRNNSYKDLDLFTESSLDFRIESTKDVLDFDTLLRATTVDSQKLKKYA